MEVMEQVLTIDHDRLNRQAKLIFLDLVAALLHLNRLFTNSVLFSSLTLRRREKCSPCGTHTSENGFLPRTAQWSSTLSTVLPAIFLLLLL